MDMAYTGEPQGTASGQSDPLPDDNEDHQAPQSGAPVAAEVEFTPAGTIAATDVQAALEELGTEKATAAALTAHESDTSTHGVADFTVLATDAEVTAAIAAHAAETAAHTTVAANRQTASYSLVVADAGKVVEMNVASANNLTVPLNATQAFPVGTVIELLQYGAGQTTIVATGGVTIRSSGGKLKLTGQYSGASLRKIATDEWSLVGDLAA
jgi:hypothetical protein